MAIQKVTITGASGQLGKHVLDALVSSGQFNLQILRRAGSSATFPSHPSVRVVDADFNSVDSLAAVLAGQDAVISTVGHAGTESQISLIDAAIKAGVSRFIPSEFGSDLGLPKTKALPIFGPKAKIIDYIEGKARDGKITYTTIRNNIFLDWGIEKNFILDHSQAKPNILDGGNHSFSATTLPTIGAAVAAVLSHPDETVNRAVYIEDTKISQQQLLKYAKEVAPGRDWQPQEVKVEDLVAQAQEKLEQGNADFFTLIPFIYRAAFSPGWGGNFQKTDNELLGLKGKTEDEVKEIVRRYVQA